MNTRFSKFSFIMMCFIMIGLAAWGSPQVQAQRPVQVDQDKNQSGIDVSGWVLMQPTGAEAEFRMPVRPRFVERRFTPVANQPPLIVKMHIGTPEGNKGSFVFSYHDMQKKPAAGKKTKDTLDGSVQGSVAMVGGKLLKHGSIRYGKHPGRAFTYRYSQKSKIFKVASRVLLIEKRQYQLSVLMEETKFDEEQAKKFLDSFRLVLPDSDLPPRPSKKPKKPGESES